MALRRDFEDYVRARCPGIWIQTLDQDDALAEIVDLCGKQKPAWEVVLWDAARETHRYNPNKGADGRGDWPEKIPDALLRMPAAVPKKSSLIFILKNPLVELRRPPIAAAILNEMFLGKRVGGVVVVISGELPADIQGLPPELIEQFVIIEHERPDPERLAMIASGVVTEEESKEEGFSERAEAALGLTYGQAETAYSLSMIRHDRLDSETIWKHKAQMLKKQRALELYTGRERFTDLGGMEGLKQFCIRSLRHKHENFEARPRGVLLLGVPGTGKSAFAKALGYEVARPTIMMDVGSLMGSLVGQTDRNTSEAFQIVDAMSPAILMIDEVEKALAGVESSGRTDSGVSARLFGKFLSWMNDHESDVFLIATCNDIDALPPAFSRAERFDGIFFCDLPQPDERQVIWDMYLKKFQIREKLDLEDLVRMSDKWTGAEIRTCCRLAAMQGVSLEAAHGMVIPVAKTSKEAIDGLRKWSSNRCLDARTGLRYEPGEGHLGFGADETGTPRRGRLHKEAAKA